MTLRDLLTDEEGDGVGVEGLCDVVLSLMFILWKAGVRRGENQYYRRWGETYTGTGRQTSAGAERRSRDSGLQSLSS